MQKKADLERIKYKEEKQKELREEAKRELKKEENIKKRKTTRNLFIVLGIVIFVLVLLAFLMPALLKNTICTPTFYSGYARGFTEGLKGSPFFRNIDDWCKIIEPAYKEVCLNVKK